jgi:hypothetical protein
VCLRASGESTAETLDVQSFTELCDPLIIFGYRRGIEQ